MQPLLDQVTGIREAVVGLKENLRHLKKDKSAPSAIAALEAKIREQEKAARDLENEATVIDAAVFDLKAVNPNATTVADERTPAQILASINEQGQIVAQALSRLQSLLDTAS